MNLLNKLVLVFSLSLCFCCKTILSCSNMTFSDKVVIVTGGSSGIGASTAIKFAKEGADVIIVGRNKTRLKEVANEISQVGKPAFIVRADLSKYEEARRVIQETVDKFGKINVLVNCAGFAKPAKISDKNFSYNFDSVQKVNLYAPMLLTSFAVRYLKITKGNIVNIASIAAQRPIIITGAPYSTSKAALVMFTKSCALELAEYGIRANTVSPGAVNTPFYKNAGLGTLDLEAAAAVTSPLGILIQPEEIADAVLYLASDKARSITGSDFVVDAGALVYDPFSSSGN